MSKIDRRRGLQASTSVLALLLGGSAPAFAQCATPNISGSVSGCVFSTTVNGIRLNAAHVAGSLASGGSIRPNGVVIDNKSSIAAITGTGIILAGPTIVGGLSNSGTITAGLAGIRVFEVTTFSGGIVNAGTIKAATGIAVGTFAATNVAPFLGGGISNSGTISAAGLAIGDAPQNTIVRAALAQQAFSSTVITRIGTFSGGIGNSGTIAATFAGIRATNISLFSGNISNSGTISAGNFGISIGSVAQFNGNITNSGTISAAIGISVGAAAFGEPVPFSANFVATPGFGGGGFRGGLGPSGTAALTPFATFNGNISNAGTIAAHLAGINVANIQLFAGNISNSGTINAVSQPAATAIAVGPGVGVGFAPAPGTAAFTGVSIVTGIRVANVATFNGSIINSGTINTNLGIVLGAPEFVAASQLASVARATFNGNIVNSGTIKAATGILISGVIFNGAIVNSGTITGTNAAIDVSNAANAVTIDQTGGLIAGTIKLSGNADMLNISGGAIDGNILGQGANTINFGLGAGTFTYTNNFSGISQVNVNSGTVILDGSNSAGNVTVNAGTLQIGDAAHTAATLTTEGPVTVAGGTLSGHGTIMGGVNVQNGGTLMPGGSIGTLTIDGNLAMSAGSVYAFEVTPTQASMAQVNGVATLGGAKVDAVLSGAAAQYGLHTGNTYKIFSTSVALGAGNLFNPAAVVSGTTVAQLLTLDGQPSLAYGANSVNVSLPSYNVTLVLPSNAPSNAVNVEQAFNKSILAGTAVPSGFQNLASLSGNALNNAVSQLAGQLPSSAATNTFNANNNFLTPVINHTIDSRTGVATSELERAPERGRLETGVSRYAPDEPLPPAASAFSALALGPGTLAPYAFDLPRLSVWSSAYGGTATISGNAATGAANTTSQVYGVVTGVDYRAMPNTIFGFALGGGGTAWQLGSGLGSGHADMFQAAIYGTSHIGPAYVSGALAYSLQQVTTTRTVTLAGFDTLQGNFAANGISLRLESGYRLPYGVVAVTPYGAVQRQDLYQPSYSEYATTGSAQFALTYPNQTFSVTRTEIGAWLDSDALIASGIKLYSRLAWAHDFDNEGSTTAVFQSLPGSSFVINSTKPASNGALVTAGFEYKLADGWSVLGKLDGEFSSTTAIFSGTGTLRKVW